MFALPDFPNDSSERTLDSSAEINATFQRGIALHQQGKLADAENIYREVLRRLPSYFEALHLLGVIALQTQQPKEGFDLIRRAIAINHNNATAHCNLGKALLELRRPEEALSSFERAIGLDPTFAMAHSNRAKTLLDLKRSEEALASCDSALAYMPTLAEAHLNRGMALGNLMRPKEALISCDKAIELKPDFPEAYNNRGNTLVGLGRFAQAVKSYEKATVLYQNFSIAHRNRGMVLKKLNRLDEAFAAYDLAYTLQPDLIGAEGDRLHVKMCLCNWESFLEECTRLKVAIKNDRANTPPFEVLPIATSAAEQLRCAKTWAAERFPPSEAVTRKNAFHYHHKRIRVAYLSADFRDHAVSILLAGVFEQHDRSQFRTIAISFGPQSCSPMTARLKASFDQFIDVGSLSDIAVAKLLRELEVDIAVDLMGYTADARTAIFTHRPSPIQVSFLGYPGTTGTDYIDYLIADQTLIPVSDQLYYAEKIAYLPNTYMPNDRNRLVSTRIFRRMDFGLPELGFVFACFNNSYKLNPDIFDRWLRILGRINGSVLWLSEHNPTAIANLRKEAANKFINPNRLIFAKRMPLIDDHLGRHRVADLFLDTLPFNAHTTAADALWAGLPVLTQIGDTFAGRVAASLLTAIGLPELITTTSEEYEDMAVALASHPEKLSALKHKLAKNRLITPLFDTTLFTKHIESAYNSMYERYHAQLRPEHIYVSP